MMIIKPRIKKKINEIIVLKKPLFDPEKSNRYKEKIIIKKVNRRVGPLKARQIPKDKGMTIARKAPKERASLKVAFMNP